MIVNKTIKYLPIMIWLLTMGNDMVANNGLLTKSSGLFHKSRATFLGVTFEGAYIFLTVTNSLKGQNVLM